MIYDVYHMRRYQVYLNSQSVKTIDTFQKEAKLSRSRVISLAVDALAQNLRQALPSHESRGGALDPLIGLIRSQKKQTNIAATVDAIYSSD